MFVVLFESGSMFTSTLEVTMDHNGHYKVCATPIGSSEKIPIKNFKDDKLRADLAIACIHKSTVARFTQYTADAWDKPILIDFTG